MRFVVLFLVIVMSGFQMTVHAADELHRLKYVSIGLLQDWAHVALKARDFNRVDILCGVILSKSPKNVKARICLGRSAYATGRYDDALVHFDELLQRDTLSEADRVPLLGARAFTCFQLNRFQDSLDCLGAVAVRRSFNTHELVLIQKIEQRQQEQRLLARVASIPLPKPVQPVQFVDPASSSQCELSLSSESSIPSALSVSSVSSNEWENQMQDAGLVMD